MELALIQILLHTSSFLVDYWPECARHMQVWYQSGTLCTMTWFHGFQTLGSVRVYQLSNERAMLTHWIKHKAAITIASVQ